MKPSSDLQTIDQLIALLDEAAETRSTLKLEQLRPSNLFSIKTNFDHGDAEAGCTIQEASDEATEPGAILVWEFNAVNWQDDAFPQDIESPEFLKRAQRLKLFVDLLNHFEISTRYDCWDSYGSQGEDPKEAVAWQMRFEMDEPEVELSKQLCIKGGLYTEEEYFEEFENY